MQKSEHIVYEFAVIVAIVGSITLCSESYRWSRLQEAAGFSSRTFIDKARIDKTRFDKTPFIKACQDDFTRANRALRPEADVACGLWRMVEN
jgi:hypothetical protein